MTYTLVDDTLRVPALEKQTRHKRADMTSLPESHLPKVEIHEYRLLTFEQLLLGGADYIRFIGAGSAESNNVLTQMETEGSKLATERMLREFARSGLMPPRDDE